MIYRLTAVPAVLALLGACAVIEPPSATETVFTNRVANRQVPFDPGLRADTLRRTIDSHYTRLGDRVCPRETDVADQRDLARLEAASVHALRDRSGSTDPLAWARVVNARAMRSMYTLDTQTAAEDIRSIARHAEAGAWVNRKPSWSNATSITLALGPLLPAWHILRQTPMAADVREPIEAWLVRVAAVADARPGGDATAILRGANNLLLGVIVDDATIRSRGLSEAGSAALATLGRDGGARKFPNDDRRGIETARAVAAMLYAESIAASFGERIDHEAAAGPSIHDAVRYLLDLPEEPGNVFSPWNGSARVWTVLYQRRYTDRDEADVALRRAEPGVRFAYDALGGWASCYMIELAG